MQFTLITNIADLYFKNYSRSKDATIPAPTTHLFTDLHFLYADTKDIRTPLGELSEAATDRPPGGVHLLLMFVRCRLAAFLVPRRVEQTDPHVLLDLIGRYLFTSQRRDQELIRRRLIIGRLRSCGVLNGLINSGEIRNLSDAGSLSAVLGAVEC